MPGFSLINASGLSQPADTLVNKISNAIGRHFDPRQTVRMAEAEARADRIRRVSEAETDIDIAELRERAAYRFANEEMTKQLNMESITKKAILHLNDDANPDAMENDWITNFFDKCRTVSDDDMQELWARILGGEGNHPGSFSRKTVNLVADLDARYATLFAKLCDFTWMIHSGYQPLIYDTKHEIYNHHGIGWGSLKQLASLGLVYFEGGHTTVRTGLPRQSIASYHDKNVILAFENDENTLQDGETLFTPAGQELFMIVETHAVEGFFEYVYDRWAGESLVPPREPAQAEAATVVDDDTEAKIQDMLEYRQLASQMRRQVASLTEQYPDQWAAMVPTGELFLAGSMDELLAILDEKGLRDGNVVIEFLDPNPAPLIL